jgi:hypothetical protein
MELNVFVEDYIKKNHSQYSDKAQEEMRKAILAGYYFAKGSNEPVDENSFDFIKSIYDKAKKIYEAEDLDDEEKYDMIFSDEISRKVSFDYYDPDTTYEEDVAAFMRGFEEYIETLQRKSKY